VPAETGARPAAAGAHDEVRGPSHAQLVRWRRAQRYELSWWRRSGAEGLRAQGERFAEGASSLTELLDAHAANNWRRAALQVGTAGVAEIHHLPVRAAFAVEPLARCLDASGLLARDGVRFVCAMGEQLPFADGRFSLALAPNVIDHVADPVLLLDELYRCLEPGGLLWLSSHVSPGWAIPAFRALRRTRIGYFTGHPWYFTAERLCALARSAGFDVRLERAAGLGDAGRAHAAGPRAALKERLLGVHYLLLERP
jgi:SAM-dependent methyltransferase